MCRFPADETAWAAIVAISRIEWGSKSDGLQEESASHPWYAGKLAGSS
jgi:hypothetical protein